jgi:hypothetical protein
MCAMAFSLTACGNTDLELQGGLFDLVGISSDALQASSGEPKVAARNPLVVPPRLDRLPAPGTRAAAPAAAVQPQAWPVDPEARKVAMAKAAKDRRKAHCQSSVIKDGEKVRGTEWFDKLSGETARCPPSWGHMYEKKAGDK